MGFRLRSIIRARVYVSIALVTSFLSSGDGSGLVLPESVVERIYRHDCYDDGRY